MTTLHIAQLNIGRIRAPLEDPLMAEFVARLDEINALAERSPGFVWRLKGESDNATYLRPFEDERIIVNMSVWESVEQLKRFVYYSAHVEVLRRRQDWFDKFKGAYAALWWVPRGHQPGVDEAKQRLAHLDAHGPSPFAFTFKQPFPADEEFARGTDWGSFKPCLAV